MSKTAAPAGAHFPQGHPQVAFGRIGVLIINLGTPDALGVMGRKAVGYYFCTTAVAVVFGLIVVSTTSSQRWPM